jgi:hypothetical protein
MCTRRSVLDRSLRRAAVLVAIAMVAGFALSSPRFAVADTVTTDFEAPLFHLGSVNGQDGWKSAVPGDIPSLPHGYDQAVVANGAGVPPAFGGSRCASRTPTTRAPWRVLPSSTFRPTPS